MKKDSFVALRDWAEQLEELPEKDQLELFWAVFRYGLNGEEPELKTYQKAIFKGFKNDIDRNQERYEALVEKRRINGKKGAEARWQNMAKDGKNGNTILANGKNGLDVDVDDNVSSNEDIKETIPKGIAKKKGFSLGVMEIQEIFSDYESKATDESYKKFLNWSKITTPYIATHLRPLTEKQFLNLKSAFGSELLGLTMENIENRKDLRKKYQDLYRTLINWCKRESERSL